MSRTRKIALQGVFVALLVASAKVSLPVIPPVPFTLQSAVVILSGLVLGWQSVIAVGIYLLLGIVGVPVFAMGGGFGYVLYPTFGFTVGFLFAALAVGIIYGKSHSLKRSIVATTVGTILIYLVGISYYLILQKFYFGESVDLGRVLLTFYVMFIPSDIIKGCLCVAIAKRINAVALTAPGK